MVEEQRRFNEQQEADWRAKGGYQMPSETWIIPGPPPSLWSRMIWWIQDRLP